MLTQQERAFVEEARKYVETSKFSKDSRLARLVGIIDRITSSGTDAAVAVLLQIATKANILFRQLEKVPSPSINELGVVLTDLAPFIGAMVNGTLTLKDAPATNDKEDAERWRALMSSQRMHWMGSAGFDNKGPADDPDTNLLQKLTPHPRPNTYMHFGMEFWSEHPADKKKYPDDFERKLMVAYVDELRRRASAPNRALEIEKLVREQYADGDTDAADLAAEEIRNDPTRNNDEIARHVAQLILLQP